MKPEKPHDLDPADEALLGRLAATLREDDAAIDPRLDALCGGTISDADRAALEADAANDPALAAALEAFRPLDEAHHAAVTDRILGLASAKAPATSEPSRPAVPLIPLTRARRSSMTTIVPVVGALAVAAAVALYVGRAGSPTLPGYELVVAGDRALRGGDAAPEPIAQLAPDSRFELVLRPSSATQAQVELRAFLVRGDAAQPWNVTPEISAEGAVRIQGRVDALFPPGAGEWGVLLIVGPRGEVDVDAARAARLYAGEAPREPLRVARTRVRVGP